MIEPVVENDVLDAAAPACEFSGCPAGLINFVRTPPTTRAERMLETVGFACEVGGRMLLTLLLSAIFYLLMTRVR